MNFTQTLLVALLSVGYVAHAFGEAEPLLKLDEQKLVYNNSILVIASKNSTLCRMVKDFCEIYFLIRSDISNDQLVISTNDQKIFKFTSIEPCAGETCLKLEEFGLSRESLDALNTSNYNMQKVKIKGLLIGNATLSFRIKNPEQGSSGRLSSLPELIFFHRVVVSAPQRAIDVIFDIFTWSFGAVISLRKIFLLSFLFHF
jgi:hypothetical protein